MIEDITLYNTVTKEVLPLSQDKTPYYVLQEVDWGQVAGKAYTFKYLNQTGETVQNVELGTRDVYIIGWVIGKDEEHISKNKSFLNMFVNPQQSLDLIYNNYKMNFTPSSTVKYGITIQENNNKMCKFKIDGVAYNPVFTNVKEDVEDIASTRPYFHFPLIINSEDQVPPQIVFGVRIKKLTSTIINDGQVPVGIKLVFKANGEVVNPVLYDIKDQTRFLRIIKVLEPGEEVDINTERGERSIIGKLNGEEINYAKYRDLDNTWLQLDIGENIFRYDADEGVDNLDVLIYYNNKFLEVQQCY